MRIGQTKDDRRRRLKPPPDYTSRRMQWRLLLAVAALMLVVTVAFEARDPSRWKWIEALSRAGQKSAPAIDPRLPATGSTPEPEPVIESRVRPQTDLATAVGAEPDTAASRAWSTAWEEVFSRLSIHDRRILYELLKADRENRKLTEAERDSAAEMLDRLDGQWAEYRGTVKSGLADLTEEERTAWLPVMEGLEQRWTTESRPLLLAVAQGSDLDAQQHATLHGLQDLLDRLELSAVRDDTPFRASEREIWFRLLGKLQQRTAEELKLGSEGLAGYAQLFKQSNAYRGKLVTVRGTVQAAYWLEAPPNAYGIERYWVYWILPEGGPNSPLLVYALSKPKGFPTIEPEDLGKRRMPSQEDVEFTGFYLKRYAYQGQGGIFTAPMLLANSPTWLAAPAARMELPSLPVALGVAGVLAALAAALATVVYYQYRPGSLRGDQLPDRIGFKPQQG
jgi:hypothetical protein